MLSLLAQSLNLAEEGGALTLEIDVQEDGQIPINNLQNVCLNLCVSSTGKGLSKEASKQLFIHFAKQDKLRDRGKDCSDLGLYITKKLVKSMNGSIQIDSEPNAGTGI